MPKQTIDITLPALLQYSSLVRELSESIFAHIGFTNEWTARLKLVVDELFMNANRYASKEGQSKIYLSFEYDESELHFRIEDEGAGEQKITAEELRKRIHQNEVALEDLHKTSGRGLALISKLWTDGFTVEDNDRGGISITFVKKVQSAAPPAPPISKTVGAQPPVTEESTPTAKVLTTGSKEVISIDGEIDASNLEEKVSPIEAKVKTLGANAVLELDCAKLRYFNSTFIGHLAAWHNALQEKGGQLVLKNANKDVQDILQLVGLSKVIYVDT